MRRSPLPSLLVLVAILVASCDGEEESGSPGLLLEETAPLSTPTTSTPSATPEIPVPTPAPTAVATATPAPVPDFPEVLLTATSGVPGYVADPALEAAIQTYIGADSSVSVVIKNLSDGRGVAINAGRVYYTASLFKIYVMFEVFHQRELGNLAFDEQLEVTQEWIDLSLGQSVYTTPGQLVSIAGALDAMITVSDNVTANMLADRAGWENIRASVAALGLSATVLGGGELLTSAADVARFLEVLYAGAGVSSGADNEMLNLMSRQQIRDRIPKYLPGGTQVANKTGSWSDVTHDAGVVYGPSGAYLVVVMVGHGDGYETIAEISRIVFQHFNP
jgi:beta-lactamase class A